MTLTQMLFCEYCEIFKNTYFEKHLRMAATTIERLLFNVSYVEIKHS